MSYMLADDLMQKRASVNLCRKKSKLSWMILVEWKIKLTLHLAGSPGTGWKGWSLGPDSFCQWMWE